ncbi:MAG: DNA methyltransferase [Tepidisphaeraceae bacterium]
MAKRSIPQSGTGPAHGLFADAKKRRHPNLFIPRLLAEAADGPINGGADRDRAEQILREWSDLAEKGHLNRKETALDDQFLDKIFGDALGYRRLSDSPDDYHRQRNFSVKGAGTADGALGRFRSGADVSPVAVIELKGAETDLDHDKFNGRTPVDQCWDYLNQLPETPWGILSNYVTIRLYHRDSPKRAFEEFTVKDFRDPARCRQFYFLFSRLGLLGDKVTEPRALALLKRTQRRQREVGDDLYDYYSEQRFALIGQLIDQLKMPQDQAISAAQRLLDRVVFMAFCEDRGLLPEKLIERTFKNVPPLARATNPRWRNFLDAFHAIDKGHPDLDLRTGYNGGLFREDPVVDKLDLDDRWAEVFKNIGEYDFRDEVNVEVLGHLFERSITELEKYRVVGLFGKQAGEDGLPAMPKSAERKRFGIYYTPPQFTRLIVENTLGSLIKERVEPLADPRAQVNELRKIKVCDPACGSGAFLIAAYEMFEDVYWEVIRAMRIALMMEEADALLEAFPDYILNENLFGVDVSTESVEITQLALWIRSARKGRTLADLSENIVCGNSLISDAAVHPRAMTWASRFSGVFNSSAGGFDVVIGNPPWERMKLQEREFFSLGAPDIAAAVNAADRRKMIVKVEAERPELWARYQEAKAAAERTLANVRSCSEFPLTARGDVNTYMLFAELARKIVSPAGRAGLLVPSGIATDDTTKHFFADLVEKKGLIALYDFENKEGLFVDVHRSYKFCILLMGGSNVKTPSADFVFFAHNIEDLNQSDRHIQLSDKDLKLLNPNTRTCPIFRSRRDAELTKRVYRNIPILVDESRKAGGNPWGVKFATMFHQTNDAELFKNAKELKDNGYRPEGNRWIKRKEIFLPLYEAKMFRPYDHRFGSVFIRKENWMNQGQTEETTLVEHQNREFVAQPRWWVAESAVRDRLPQALPPALLAFRDVTRSTDERTMLACFIPVSAVTNTSPLMLFDTKIPAKRQACLLANLNSIPFDYVAKQKVGHIHMNFFIVEQLPTFPPELYDDKCPWNKKQKLEDWIADRVLKLTCTSEDMIPLAAAGGFEERVHKWKERERAQLRAELDAAYFILYGIERADIEYILGTFQGVAKEDESHGGVGETRELILEAFDKLSNRV